MADHGKYMNPETSLAQDSVSPRGLYINITNRCPCACTFCLRSMKHLSQENNLWLQDEPTVEEVKKLLDGAPWDVINEVVFCGFGEPTERLSDVITLLKYVKKTHPMLKTRVNTNGLSDLVYNRDTSVDFEGGFLDTISISLNDVDAESYLAITRSKFGIVSYESMLDFAVHCKKYVPNVVMTVVDHVLPPEKIERCREICEDRGLTLRVRPYEDS